MEFRQFGISSHNRKRLYGGNAWDNWFSGLGLSFSKDPSALSFSWREVFGVGQWTNKTIAKARNSFDVIGSFGAFVEGLTDFSDAGCQSGISDDYPIGMPNAFE